MESSECMPPYYPSAPEKIGDKFKMVNAPGYTYYNSSYRGGSQVENYTERCVPIFPSYDVNFPCTFYLVSDTKIAYLETKGAPEEFGECCIL